MALRSARVVLRPPTMPVAADGEERDQQMEERVFALLQAGLWRPLPAADTWLRATRTWGCRDANSTAAWGQWGEGWAPCGREAGAGAGVGGPVDERRPGLDEAARVQAVGDGGAGRRGRQFADGGPGVDLGMPLRKAWRAGGQGGGCAHTSGNRSSNRAWRRDLGGGGQPGIGARPGIRVRDAGPGSTAAAWLVLLVAVPAGGAVRRVDGSNWALQARPAGERRGAGRPAMGNRLVFNSLRDGVRVGAA